MKIQTKKAYHGPIDLIGRVFRVDQVGEGKHARWSYEFDCVNGSLDLGRIHSALKEVDDLEPFSVVRILTTPARFQQLGGSFPKVGDWFFLQLSNYFDLPIAYFAPLQGSGYGAMQMTRLGYANRLFSEFDGEPPRSPLGAEASSEAKLARDLADACQFPRAAVKSNDDIAEIFKQVGRPDHAIVEDVGQGSYTTFRDANRIVLFSCDAGWPIVFNASTYPRTFFRPTVSHPIILSHWDFDHLLGYYRFPVLKGSIWVAPVQNLGPGAKKIAVQLSRCGRLFGVVSGTIKMPWGEIIRCTGPSRSPNNSGLAVMVDMATSKRVLFAGDASYENIPVSGQQPDRLVVTHHGARFEGEVVSPNGIGYAVVSVGRGNVYRHPKKESLDAHARAHWAVDRTSSSQFSLTRGRRRLC